MDWAGGIIVGLFIGFFLCIFGFVFGTVEGQERLMRQAFERGHAVQCLGKEGYFWECEE